MGRHLSYTYLTLLGIILAIFSCNQSTEYRLQRQETATTGIDFVNQLTEDDTTNILFNEYLYNGGGVGVGDFDGNGLPDLFFGGNMVSSRLYLQLSPWAFADVTEAAGLTTTAWVSGVNVSDVDGDGSEDLYLATLNPDGGLDSPNLLFLNKGNNPEGIPTFWEAASELGLDNPSYSTHSAWLDLEGDGDLDLYLLNNSLEETSRKTLRGTDSSGVARSLDVVYENIGGPTGPPGFVRSAGHGIEGWGLGVIPQDFNGDGLTDLYIANDFISDDLLLINDGRQLTWQTKAAFPHTSQNSMGVDAADLNNDGYPEIMTADMLPDDNLRQKTMFSDIPFRSDATADQRGYVRQYVRNALQLNNGDGTFSDIAFQTGTAATDWSWTPLLADFDNNGYRDIFISNGYPRDVTNRDFVDFAQNDAMFGSDEMVIQNTLTALSELDGVHQPNYIFSNHGALNFTLSDWLPEAPTYSNGAAYVDLDGDGDLDLVTNNLNEPAGIYRNYSREHNPDGTHYFQLELAGPRGNTDALGAKVYLTYGEHQHAYAEQQRQRGYLSTVDAKLHFGLGAATDIDSVLVIWPDKRESLLTKLPADTLVTLSYRESTAPARRRPTWSVRPQAQLTALPTTGPAHRESAYSDFDNFALSVRDRSHAGPALVTADLDGDGSEELIMGGAAGQPTTVYIRQADSLVKRQVLEPTRASEATALAVLDYDGDGDQDLYVGNGSQEFFAERDYQDVLFENVEGQLRVASGSLPDFTAVTTAVATADLEGDGDADLFVGSGYRLNAYPRSTPSYVLRNEGGKFSVAQELEVGLVTDAVWADMNGDGLADLVTVAEYGPPRIYLNRAGVLEARLADERLNGWWYSLTPIDLDQDGDLDLLAGNVGLNSFYRASPEHPLRLRVADYDNNGTLDPIMLMDIGGRTHPVHPRNTLGRQLPNFKKQATTYATYGSWAVENMPDLGEAGFELSATEFRSVYLENDGTGNFSPYFLPATAQTAPVRDALPVSLPDGRPALLVVQNDHATEVLGGRLDAGTGFLLSLRGGEPVVDSHYWSVRGDARSVVHLDSLVVVGINDGPLRLYRQQTDPAVPSR